MNDSSHPRIVSSEWLPSGVMVHFEKSVSVFYPAEFLYDQRERNPNRIFRPGEEPSES
jgi:hypothetical protein